MFLELGEVFEGVGVVELAGMDQAHEEVADAGAVPGLVEIGVRGYPLKYGSPYMLWFRDCRPWTPFITALYGAGSTAMAFWRSR